jgi:hypothetical protein
VPRYAHGAHAGQDHQGEEKVTAVMPFTCSICGEASTRICARCTKDACDNHLCDKCLRCSDCCECEVVLDDSTRPVVRPAVEAVEAVVPEPEPHEPVPPEPEPDPAEPGDETGDSTLNSQFS